MTTSTNSVEIDVIWDLHVALGCRGPPPPAGPMVCTFRGRCEMSLLAHSALARTETPGGRGSSIFLAYHRPFLPDRSKQVQGNGNKVDGRREARVTECTLQTCIQRPRNIAGGGFIEYVETGNTDASNTNKHNEG